MGKVWAFLVAQTGKNLPAMQETWVQSWVGKILWRREWLLNSSILAWRISWTEDSVATARGVAKSGTRLCNEHFNFHVTKLERVGAWSCKCQLLGGVEEPSSSLHKAVTTTDIYLTFHLLHLIWSSLRPCRLPHPCVNREFIRAQSWQTLWSIFLCGCVILECVCGDPWRGWLGIFTGQVSGGGSDTCIPDAPPGLGGLWAARTASPKAPSCRASSSWLPPPWELDDHGQLLWSPQGDLWHWQVTIWKCRLNTHMLSKTWHSQTYLFWYSSFLWNFFY